MYIDHPQVQAKTNANWPMITISQFIVFINLFYQPLPGKKQISFKKVIKSMNSKSNMNFMKNLMKITMQRKSIKQLSSRKRN